MNDARLIIRPHRRTEAIVLVALIYAAAYWGAAALAWRDPTVLSPSRFDESIPVLPLAIWIYVSEVLLITFAIWVPDSVTRTRAVFAMTVSCTAAGATFFLYPTAIPRLAPIPSGMTGVAWKVLYAVDTPYNAFPSLHAAFAVAATAALWRVGPAWRAIGLIWAIGVMAAALATKQHFVVDLLAGLCLGALAHVLGRKWINVCSGHEAGEVAR